MSKLYYSPPPKEQFDELKEKAIEVWETYDNQFGYVDEKVERIKDLKNVSDNFMYMVAMFDILNQKKLSLKLSPKTKQSVKERMIDGGTPSQFIVF